MSVFLADSNHIRLATYKNMSAKLSKIRAYEVENRVVAVPKSWKRESVAMWQTKEEGREIEPADVRVMSLSETREFFDGKMSVAKKVEMEDFTAEELPLELI